MELSSQVRGGPTPLEPPSLVRLLALHGNGGGASRYALCRAYFEPLGIDFVAHTLPGFEGRPLRQQPLSWGEIFNDLDSTLEAFSEPPWLLGHGIGASVLLQYLQTCQRPLAGVILHSPVGARLDKRRFPRLMKPLWVRALVQRALSFPPAFPFWSRLLFRRPLPASVTQKFFAEYGRCQAFSSFFDLLTPQWFAALQPLDFPVQLLWGQKERVLSADQVDAFREVLPRARVHLEPDWDHFPMLEQPLEYARRIAQIVLGLDLPWLGQGSVREDLPPKALQLDRATRAGLPVPAAFWPALEAPQTSLPGFWAVRSAHRQEDQAALQAGRYRTLLSQAGDCLGAALQEVVEAQAGQPALVMQMIRPIRSGVAFLEADFEEDRVNWIEGLGESLLAGHQSGSEEDLPRLDLGFKPVVGWRGQLQHLLARVRQAFPGNWDLEWAQDENAFWLLQMRPILAPTRRPEWFTAANQREILPDPPSPWMVGILRRSRARLFDYYRQFDPELPSGRLFLDLFRERPFLNLSLLHGMMVRWGLPTRLVTDNIGGASLPEVGWRPGRMLQKLTVFRRLVFDQGQALGRTSRVIARLQELSQVDSREQCLENFAEMYVQLVHQMMALTAGMSLPLALLRRVGTLAEHNARFEVESTRMLRDLEPLRRLDPHSPAFTEALADYVGSHGHRGAFESDIASPRVAEDPLAWVLPLLPFAPPAPEPLSWRGWLTLPLAWWAAPWVRAREHLRSEAMRSFARVRSRVLEWSSLLGLEGDRAWLLSPEEWVEWKADRDCPDFWRRRQGEQRELEALELPPLVRSFQELQEQPEKGFPERNCLQGVPLTRGRVAGRAWVCRRPGPPPDWEGPSILVARAIDPGWLPAFAQAQAVLVEIGGDLSHGSILLRELGIPAITNIHGLWGWAQPGDWLEVDADSGTVRKGHSDP